MFVFTIVRIDEYTPMGTIIDVSRAKAAELYKQGKIADPAIKAETHERKHRNTFTTKPDVAKADTPAQGEKEQTPQTHNTPKSGGERKAKKS